MKPHSATAPVSLLRECLATFHDASRGPLEQGGLLLGTRSRSGCLIYGTRELPGALRSPRSLLPSRWRPSPGLRREVVGWFHTHPAGGLHLSRADVRVHRHLFPRREGLALVVGTGRSPPGISLALYGGSPLRAVEALRLL